MFNKLAVLDLLLARGADPHATDTDGHTARQLADAMGATDAADRLGSLPATPT